MNVDEGVTALIEQLDKAATKGLEGEPVTCTVGCAGCCYQLVVIGISEASRISNEMVGWPDLKSWLARLGDAAEKMTAPDMNETSWFERAIPCVFLTEENTCRIYDIRPSACRYHFVRTPKENCFPGAIDPNVQGYDLSELGQEMIKYDWAVFLENPHLGPPSVSVLPHLILYLFSVRATGGIRLVVRKMLEHLPSPHEWWLQHLPSVDVSSMKQLKAFRKM